MTKIILLLIFQFTLIFMLYPQLEISNNNSKHHLLFSGCAHWNKARISSISGNADKFRSAAVLGFVFDIGYKYAGKHFLISSSIGHGVYSEGVYYEYNLISESDFSFSSDKSFLTNSNLQYSSVKFMLSAGIMRTRNLFISFGFDLRVNWGYRIYMDQNERNDISYGGKQVLGGTPLLSDFTQLYQSSSKLERNLSINPLLGLDYAFNLPKQNLISFGVLYSIPLLRLISSEVVLYPEYDDLKSTLNTKYYGGFLGLRLIFSMPIRAIK